MPNVRVANFFGGFPIKQQIEQLKTNTPHAVVGTPGRLKQASSSYIRVLFVSTVRQVIDRQSSLSLKMLNVLRFIRLLCVQLSKSGLNLKTIRHFIIDECDKVLENIGKHFEITGHTIEKCYEVSFPECTTYCSLNINEVITDGDLCALQTCARMSRKFSSRRRTISKS